MAADKTAAAQDAPKQPRRSISAKLKPVSGVAAKTAAKAGPAAGETPAAPAPEEEPFPRSPTRRRGRIGRSPLGDRKAPSRPRR